MCRRGDGDAATDGGRAYIREALRAFTLVGIAGEDGLDAPDLNLGVEAGAERNAAKDGVGSSNGKRKPLSFRLVRPKRREAQR